MAARYQIYKLDTSSVSGTTTTLNGTINASVTAIVVTSGTGIVNGTVISIGTEHIFVSAGGGTVNLTGVRGWAGTTAASHTSGVTVNIPGALSYNLLQVMGVANQQFTFAKVSTDINYVQLVTFSGDTFPGGGTTLILADGSSAYGTVRMSAPASSTQWIITAGAGASGSSGGGGGGGTPGGTDKNIQVNNTGAFYGTNSFNFDYTKQSMTIVGGSTTNGSQIILDTAASSQVSGIFFYDHATSTWQIGRNATDFFFVYDVVNTTNIILAAQGGALTLQPVTDLDLIPASGNVNVTGNLIAFAANQNIGTFGGNWWGDIYGITIFANVLDITNSGASPYYRFGFSGSSLVLATVLSSIPFSMGTFTKTTSIPGSSVMTWDGNITPASNNVGNLGSNVLNWNTGYFNNIISNNANLGVTLIGNLGIPELGGGSFPAAPASGYGGLGYQTGAIYSYYNASTSAWASVNFSLLSPPGSDTDLLYNKSGGLGADSNLTWIYGSQQLVVTGNILAGSTSGTLGSSSGNWWNNIFGTTIFVNVLDITNSSFSPYYRWGFSGANLVLATNLGGIPFSVLNIYGGTSIPGSPTLTVYGTILPSSSNIGDFGSNSLFWNHAYVTNVMANTSIYMGSTQVINSSGSFIGAGVAVTSSGIGGGSFGAWVSGSSYSFGIGTGASPTTISPGATLTVGAGLILAATAGGNWTTYSPTTTNLSSVSTDCAYIQLSAKTYLVRIGVQGVVITSSTAITVTLPFTPFSTYQSLSGWFTVSGFNGVTSGYITGGSTMQLLNLIGVTSGVTYSFAICGVLQTT